MNSTTKEKNIISVIDEFDYSTQNETYNQHFREWRMRKNNRYSFSFRKNERERVYIDGRGFVEKSFESAEKRTLSQIFHTIGYAALMWLVLENVAAKIAISCLDFFGMNIHINYASSIFYGGCHEVTIALVTIDILKILLPLIYLHFKIKTPKKAELMGSMNNPSALVGAISAAFIVSVIASIPSAYSMEVREAVSFFNAVESDTSIWNQFDFLLYTVSDLLVIPILSQLLFCGAAFVALRQFGDAFALIVTAFSAAVLTQDFNTMPAIFLITLISSCGMLTSGSIFTAISVNVIYRMYNLTLALIETDTSENMPFIRNMFMAVVVIAGTIGLAYFRLSTKKKPLNLAHYNSSITFMQRIIHSSRTFPYSAVAIICIIYALIKAVR